MVKQGIHAHAEEISHVDFYDRPQSGHGGGHSGSKKSAFAYGGASDAPGPEPDEKFAPQQRSILSEKDDPRVLGHSLSDGLVDGLGE